MYTANSTLKAWCSALSTGMSFLASDGHAGWKAFRRGAERSAGLSSGAPQGGCYKRK